MKLKDGVLVNLITNSTEPRLNLGDNLNEGLHKQGLSLIHCQDSNLMFLLMIEKTLNMAWIILDNS